MPVLFPADLPCSRQVMQIPAEKICENLRDLREILKNKQEKKLSCTLHNHKLRAINHNIHLAKYASKQCIIS